VETNLWHAPFVHRSGLSDAAKLSNWLSVTQCLNGSRGSRHLIGAECSGLVPAKIVPHHDDAFAKKDEKMELFSFKPGNSPLLVSMPHSGRCLPTGMKERMTRAGRDLVDTDWYIPRLYNFLESLDVSVLQANYSRYVVDLNRATDGRPLYPGQQETQVCPTSTFMSQDMYKAHEAPVKEEVSTRLLEYWLPYHRKLRLELERMVSEFGYALLWDAHSIQSQLPVFFQGTLPDLNMGTAGGASCDQSISDAI